MEILPHLQSALGIVVIITLAWVLSENRRAFPWRIVLVGISLQAGIAILLLKVSVARDALFGLNGIVTVLTAATKAGTGFVYGYVGGSDFTPFTVTNPAALTNFAFTILPLVIIISALSAILWYWRVLPVIVGGMAFVLRRTLGIGGAGARGARAPGAAAGGPRGGPGARARGAGAGPAGGAAAAGRARRRARGA